MDASGHLRTVSALLDLDEFEVVDLQQDRRTKQNVIGVIPKAAADDPPTRPASSRPTTKGPCANKVYHFASSSRYRVDAG